MVSIIAAIDEKRGLGKDNKLLFHIPEDFKRMKQLTSGHPIIMGRKTFESIGRPLPNRTNIIITRDLTYKVDGAVVVHSLEEAIEVGKKQDGKYTSSDALAESRSSQESSQHQPKADHPMDEARIIKDEEIFIFGGGEIYKQAMPYTDRLYLTVVKGSYDADTFFPEYSAFKKIIYKEKRSENGYEYTFLTLEK